MKYEKHPLNILPNCSKEDYRRLCGSIRRDGFDSKFPILLFEGKILDGWQRYRVCQEDDLEFPTIKFDGEKEEAVIFIRESNFRRNLTPDQIATFIIDSNGLLDRYKEESRKRSLTNLKQNQDKTTEQPPTDTFGGVQYKAKAAKDFGTTRKKITRAEKLKEASPEKYEEVKNGTKKLHEAEKEVPALQKKPTQTNTPKTNPIFSRLSTKLDSAGDDLQKLLQGEYKPNTTIEWAHMESIRFSLYDIVRVAAELGIDVVKIADTFNGQKKIVIPKHLRKPKSTKTTDIVDVEIVK